MVDMGDDGHVAIFADVMKPRALTGFRRMLLPERQGL